MLFLPLISSSQIWPAFKRSIHSPFSLLGWSVVIFPFSKLHYYFSTNHFVPNHINSQGHIFPSMYFWAPEDRNYILFCPPAPHGKIRRLMFLEFNSQISNSELLRNKNAMQTQIQQNKCFLLRKNSYMNKDIQEHKDCLKVWFNFPLAPNCPQVKLVFYLSVTTEIRTHGTLEIKYISIMELIWSGLLLIISILLYNTTVLWGHINQKFGALVEVWNGI